MLDTTVYIDAQKAKLPVALAARIASAMSTTSHAPSPSAGEVHGLPSHGGSVAENVAIAAIMSTAAATRSQTPPRLNARSRSRSCRNRSLNGSCGALKVSCPSLLSIGVKPARSRARASLLLAGTTRIGMLEAGVGPGHYGWGQVGSAPWPLVVPAMYVAGNCTSYGSVTPKVVILTRAVSLPVAEPAESSAHRSLTRSITIA